MAKALYSRTKVAWQHHLAPSSTERSAEQHNVSSWTSVEPDLSVSKGTCYLDLDEPEAIAKIYHFQIGLGSSLLQGLPGSWGCLLAVYHEVPAPRERQQLSVPDP